MNMRNILMIFMLAISFSSFSYDHVCDVYGEDEYGHIWQGEIKSNNGDQNVSGELTDDRGETKEFEGIWVGKGLITGELDGDFTIDLEVDE